jgi:hypothetical protein
MKSLFGGQQRLDFVSHSVELDACTAFLDTPAKEQHVVSDHSGYIAHHLHARHEARNSLRRLPSIVVYLIMLFFSKPKATFSSLGQDSEDDAERDGMLEKNEYAGEKVTPKSRRFWSSNVPWMCSTLVLSVYIIATSVHQRKTPDLWSPTDLSTSLPIPCLNTCLHFRTRSAIS